MKIPHSHSSLRKANCAVVTVSDSRNKNNDESGHLIQNLLTDFGHDIPNYEIVKDEPQRIKSLLEKFTNNQLIDAIIFSGGTGISPRDNTYDILSQMLEKELSGFGEIFRWLSYQEIGSRAIASRATAGIYQSKVIFSLPGSKGAVTLGMTKLILPELTHLITQVKGI